MEEDRTMDEQVDAVALNPVDRRKVTRQEQRVSLRRYVLIAVSVMAALRIVLFVLSLFLAWPVGGAATYAIASSGGLGLLGVATELMLVVAVVVGTANIAAGLRTRQRRWYSRAQLLGWLIIGNTVFYLGSLIVGLWAVDGWSLVAENSAYLVAVLVLHLPLLWLSVRVIGKARRLAGDRTAGATQQQ
jgi:hypothetical protein